MHEKELGPNDITSLYVPVEVILLHVVYALMHSLKLI